eukprot:scaffold143154_cov244-Phaeocystis_antarctica.AAC.1
MGLVVLGAGLSGWGLKPNAEEGYRMCAHHDAKRASDDDRVLVDHDRSAYGGIHGHACKRLAEDGDCRPRDVDGMDIEQDLAGSRRVLLFGPSQDPGEQDLTPAAPDVEQTRAHVEVEELQQ